MVVKKIKQKAESVKRLNQMVKRKTENFKRLNEIIKRQGIAVKWLDQKNHSTDS